MSQPFFPSLLPSPFHLRTARLCNTNAWVEENGWTKPAYFNDPQDEYWALRSSAGIYDLAGLIPYKVSGRDAAPLLDYVMTDNMTALAVGTARHCLWCDDQGHILGDGVVYRLSRDEFRIFTRQKTYLWLAEAAVGFEATVEDLSRSLCGLAVQGPEARDLLLGVGLSEAATLRPLDIAETELQKVPVLIGRVSCSAELGFEIFVEANDALFLWDELMHCRAVLPTAVGVDAMRTATIEAGHPRHGVDYLSPQSATRPHRAASPFDLGLGGRVDFNKPYFVGRNALEQKRSDVPHQSLVGISYAGPSAFTECPIHAGGKPVGATTNVVWSPKLAQYIGFAWILSSVQASHAPLSLQGHYVDELKVEAVDVPIHIVPRPFFTASTYLETPVATA